MTTINSSNCRLCLMIDTNLRCIFGDEKWGMKDISEIINDCVCIKVTVNDCTTGICLGCYKEITSIMAFRQKCAKANEYILRWADGDIDVEAQTKPVSNESNESSKLSEEKLVLMDLAKEDDLLASKSLWQMNDIHEFSDYEIPSPEFIDNQDDNNVNLSDDTTKSPDDRHVELENNSRKSRLKTRLKESTKESACDWPKLKKRDLMETKAYRGLCHLCGKEYQHLWVHLQSHSEVPTETCDKCGKGFRSKANLSLHILLHKEAEMPCDVCGKKYRTKMRLKRHMRVHTQNRPFFCNVCEKRFYTKYNLEVHGRIHSGERPFGCTAKNCNERFAHSYALKHHMEKAHKHANITST